MALRQIVTLPDPILRRRAKPVTKFDKALQTLIDDMIETMREAPGVGLAAPQVDISQQLIVVEYAEGEEDDEEKVEAAGEEPPAVSPQDRSADPQGRSADPQGRSADAESSAAMERDSKPQKPRKLFVMINPEIMKTSEETVVGFEGCLSIPGLQGEVERFEALQVKGLNRHGHPYKIKVDGWLARIFQHEIDHINGVLFTDRATRVWKLPDPDSAEEV
jgi:peptide deformylase